MKRCLPLTVILIITLNCGHLAEYEEVKNEFEGKTIEMGMFDLIQQGKEIIPFQDFRNRYEFILLVYLQEGCLRSYSHFTQYHTIFKNDAANLTVLFIIEGESYDKFVYNVMYYAPHFNLKDNRFYSVIDNECLFFNANREILLTDLKNSILLDRNNAIHFTGQPFSENFNVKLNNL